MRMCTLVLILLCASPLALFAGDAATFASLGQSPEGRYFAFAQFGEQDGSGYPYAEIYIVDVKQNAFVPGGVIKKLWRQDAEPLPSGLHVLLELRVQTDSLFKAYDIQAYCQPEEIVASTNSERVHAQWTQDDGRQVNVLLEQKSRGEIGAYSSSAAFQLELAKAGDALIRIGAIKRFRKHVIRYDLDRVLRLHENVGIIVVIRMTAMGFEGPDIRYMVETHFNESNPGKNK